MSFPFHCFGVNKIFNKFIFEYSQVLYFHTNIYTFYLKIFWNYYWLLAQSLKSAFDFTKRVIILTHPVIHMF